MKTKFIAVLVASVFVLGILSSCVTSTNVRFNTDVPGATVFVDGEEIGTTPTQEKMSNGVWKDPDILIRMDGYKDLQTGVTKEVKAVNLVTGLTIWLPSLLWVYGPKKNQNFVMIQDKK